MADIQLLGMAEEISNAKSEISGPTSTSVRQLTEAEKAKLNDDTVVVSDFRQMKLEKEALKNWDLFYKRNTTKFFKDRNWTKREFEELSGKNLDEEKLVVLEAGCGVGNFLFPLLKDSDIFFYACDFSPRAVQFVKENEHYNTERCQAFQCDLTADLLTDNIKPGYVDICSLIFVLSAIHPGKMINALCNINKVLKVGGCVLFRDYGLYDHAMLRFSKGHKLSENFYVRQDGTRAYYFTLEKLRQLFVEAGFTEISNEYILRETVNKKEGLCVPRVFIQAKFIKEKDTASQFELSSDLSQSTASQSTCSPGSSDVQETSSRQLQKGMKAVILGAGFGTRLQRDVNEDTSGKYCHLHGIPKPLLPVGKMPIVSHWATALQDVSQIKQVYVVTNGANHGAFQAWQSDWPDIQLISDGAMTNEERSGAVACINLAVKHFSIQDELLIIAGDTLFLDDFSLLDILQRYEAFKLIDDNASMLVYVTCTDEEVHKYGILELDNQSRVVNFLEKPSPTETTSRKECPCFYIINKNSLSCLAEFLDEMKNEPIKAKDATGNFIAYLCQRKPVYATEISGRFDVGGLQSYITCHEHFLYKSN